MTEQSPDFARAARSLDGLSVGDAFGDRVTWWLDRRPVRLPPGPWAWTDDTLMALSIMEVLELYGRIDRMRWHRRSHAVSARSPTADTPRVQPGCSRKSATACPGERRRQYFRRRVGRKRRRDRHAGPHRAERRPAGRPAARCCRELLGTGQERDRSGHRPVLPVERGAPPARLRRCDVVDRSQRRRQRHDVRHRGRDCGAVGGGGAGGVDWTAGEVAALKIER